MDQNNNNSSNDIECHIRKIKKNNFCKNELKELINLKHPSIIKHYDIQESEKNVIIYQELISDGQSIENVVDKSIFFTQDTVRNILEQILLALRYLHNNNIIHRDLTCDNIILFDNGNSIKIVDFGCTKTRFLNQDYLAPEIINNGTNQDVDDDDSSLFSHKSDIWSFGIIVLKMIGLNSIQQLKDNKSLISNQQYDFIIKCLTVNTSSRSDAQTLLHHPFIINKPILKRTSKSIKSIILPKKQIEFVNKTQYEIIILADDQKSSIYLNGNESLVMNLSSIELIIGIRYDDGCVLSSPRPTKLENNELIIDHNYITSNCSTNNITFPNVKIFELGLNYFKL